MDAAEAVKWAITAIVIPISCSVGSRIDRRISDRKTRKEEQREVIVFLQGLPNECKAVLEDCYIKRTHSFIGDKMKPEVRLLMSFGLIQEGPGFGSRYQTFNYLHIPVQVWNVIPEWIRIEDEEIKKRAIRDVSSGADSKKENRGE